LFGGKGRERSAHLHPSRGHERIVHHVFRNIFVMDGFEVRHPFLSPAEPFLPPDGVDGPVVHEGEEERPERAAGGIVCLRGTPKGEECVVDHVLREHGLGGESVRESVRRGGVPPVQGVERLAVAGREAAMKLEVLPIAVAHVLVVSEDRTRTAWAARRYDRRVRVVLYSREGCHLCDVARDVILAERSGEAFAFDEVDIGGDDGLELEYGIRVPVVEIDGLERFEVEVDAARFAALVRSG
jgi:Glutaredoxin-like domain (DUF836)